MTWNCADSKRLVGCLALPLIFFVCLGVTDISIWSARDSLKFTYSRSDRRKNKKTVFQNDMYMYSSIHRFPVWNNVSGENTLCWTWDSHLDKKLFGNLFDLKRFGYWWGLRELLFNRIICVCRKVCSTSDGGEGALGAPRGEAREQQKRHWQSLLHLLEPRSRSS